MKVFESLGRLIITGLSIVMLYYIRLTYYIIPEYYLLESEVIFYFLVFFLIIWVMLPVLEVKD